MELISSKKKLLNPMYWLGAVSVACIVVLVLSGFLLSLWYEPSPERAYESITFISEYVYFGTILLSLHHHATHLLLITLLLHMLRVYFMGAYKSRGSNRRRREWVIGWFIFIFAVLFVFSGYLLRWDELGYWSIKVTASVVGYTPVAGDALLKFILGGADITSRTLSRFYMWHMFFLPVVSMLFVGIHYYGLRKSSFYWSEVGVILITCGFLMLFSVLFPFELSPKPSAELATAIKPIWLFLWLYTFERGIGMLGPALNPLNIAALASVALLLLSIPYIDTGEETKNLKKKRKWAGVFFLALFLALTLVGYLWEPPL